MIGWLIGLAGNLILRTTSNRVLTEIAGRLVHGDDNASRIAVAEINAEVEARKAVAEVRLATAGFGEMRFLAFMITAPFVLHLWAVALDTIFGLGWGIPKFPAPFDQHGWSIMLSYFGLYGATSAIAGVTRALRR